MTPVSFRQLAAVGGCLAITAAAAAAAATQATPTADAPDHIIVTASREPEAAFAALAPVIVIERDDIERSLAPDIADLLRFHAGLDLGRAGGPGQQTSLFIRGTNSNHSVVLVDGVRINPGTLGVPAIQNIAPELVDHIEIVKGPRSTLYGTDAIGGVVNVITRQPEGERLQALVGYGRYDTRQAYAGGQYGGAAGSVSLAVNYLDSAGFPTRRGDEVSRGYRDTSVALAGRTAVGDVELGARAWRSAGNTQYSDYFLAPVDQNYENASYAIDAGGALTEHWRARITLSRITDDIRQAQSPDFATTRRSTLDWQNGVDLGAQVLTFGGLLSQERAKTSVFGTGFDVDTRADTWYAQDRLTIGRHRLQAAVGYTHHEAFGEHTTWNAEYGYAPRGGTLLTAAAGTAFRAPSSTDLYGYAGNPALRPESSRNLELGLRQRLGSHQTLALAVFENRIDQLIEFVDLPDPPDFGQVRNVDRARIRGFEASYEWRSETWRARLEASRQNPEDLTTGTQLRRRARSSATLALTRRLGAHEFAVDVLAVGPRSDVDYPSDVRLGGYTLANLALRFALAPRLSLQARLENVFDRRYELAYGYNTMRRSLMVATRYEFR